MRKLLSVLLLALVVLGVVATFAIQEPIILECDSSVISIDRSTGTAHLEVLPKPIRGTMSETDDAFFIVFHNNESRYETHVAIQKTTGSFAWEHGLPPFGAGNFENHLRVGMCLKKEAFVR
jgi:hypothetical protein